MVVVLTLTHRQRQAPKNPKNSGVEECLTKNKNLENTQNTKGIKCLKPIVHLRRPQNKTKKIFTRPNLKEPWEKSESIQTKKEKESIKGKKKGTDNEQYRWLRLFPKRFDFELQICIIPSKKGMPLLMQSEYAKSDRNFFDLRIR